MKVDVTINDLRTDQVAAVLLLLPTPETEQVYWRVERWASSGSKAAIEITGIEDDALQGIFFELKERTVKITSSRKDMYR